MNAETIMARLEPHIDKTDPDGCWNWTGPANERGRPRIMIRSVKRYATRWMYEAINGSPVPDGKQLNHHCDNERCVNPDHFYVGTQLENIADRQQRRRHFGHSQTHCKHGHEFTIDNTSVYFKDGKPHRACRECNRKGAREYARRKRAEARAA